MMQSLKRRMRARRKRATAFSPASFRLCAPVQLGEDKLVVSQRFGGSQPAIDRALQNVERMIGGLIEGHLHAQNSRDIEVNVFGHGFERERISADFDYRDHGIADNISLA